MTRKQGNGVGRRIQPKLRMVANGSTAVNVLRAEHSSAVAASSSQVVRRFAPEQVRTSTSVAVNADELPKRERRGHLDATSGSILTNVFIEVTDPDAAASIPGATAVQGNLVSARVSLKELAKLAARPGVSHVEMGEALKAPLPIEGPDETRGPSTQERSVDHRKLHKDGDGVLIGIVDVGGFDFAHEDFLRSDSTRFEAIWDQGGNARSHPKLAAAPGRFDYGAEFRKSHLDRAIRAADKLRIPAWEIEKQSQISTGSHGTHVASIAAGNRGVARKAKIAGVLVSLPSEDQDRRLSFYDSTRIADAIDYLVHLAPQLGCKAVSINVSLGTNGHGHDASSAVSRWIDARLASPGRSVCVAAGNAGQEAPTSPGDYGYVTGRIHTSGKIPASGLDRDIEWVVVGDGIADLSENELEIWYGAQDRFSVSIKPPGGSFIGPIEPGQFLENEQLSNHKCFVSCYNELYHPANGSNYIGIYLSPFLTRSGVVGVKAGTWVVRLHGNEVRDGSYDGWIERDDPRRIGRSGTRGLWRFPSFFSTRSNVDRSSVSSLACGQRIVSVANLDKEVEAAHVTSSQGPTRDGRQKPEVAAPGTAILAARGFAHDGRHWVRKTGTSMASPYVAGVVGLMLATDETLTAAQVGGILKRTARPLPGADFNWRNDAGFGEVDAAECVLEASRVHVNEDLTS